MMRKIFGLLLLFSFHKGMAQVESPGLLFTIELQEGLASRKINDLYEDKAGFLWIATNNIFQRYDSHVFLSINSDVCDNFPLKPVQKIVPLDEDLIWLIFHDEVGIFHVKNFSYRKVESPLEHLPEDEVDIYSFPNGESFMVVSGIHIFHYDRSMGFFSNNVIPLQWPKGWHIRSLTWDEHLGGIWLLGRQGLAFFDLKSGILSTSEKNQIGHPLLQAHFTELINLFRDSKGNYWVNYWPDEQKLVKLSKSSEGYTWQSIKADKQEISYCEIKQFFEDSKGDIWVYGLNIIASNDTNNQNFVSPPFQSLKDKFYTKVLESKEGILWIGSDLGLFYLMPQTETIREKAFEGKEKGYYLTAALEQEDNLWISTWGKGLVILDQQAKEKSFSHQYRKAIESSDKNLKLIWDIKQLSTGEILMACQWGWLQVIDPSTGDFRFFKPKNIGESTLRKIKQDSRGNIWLGTQRGILAKMPSGVELHDSAFQALGDFGNIIQDITIDTQGRMWISVANRGIHQINPENGKSIQHYINKKNSAHSLGSNNILQLLPYQDSLLFAISDKLHVINIHSGIVENFSFHEGLCSNALLSMELDRQGYLWLNTNDGICRFHYPSKSFQRFDEMDGFFSYSPDGYLHYQKADGSIIFGGPNLLFEFDPGKFHSPRPIPDIQLTAVYIGEKFVPISSKDNFQILLKPGENSFRVQFSNMTMRDKNKISYQYRLQGIDNQIYTQKNPEIKFNQVRPGRYSLHIQMLTEEGLMGVPLVIPLVVKPYFWQSYWFFLVLLVMLVGILYFAYRTKIERLLAIENLRSKVARDLHDDMGSTLSTINILSTMAQSKLSTEPQKSSELLARIGENSQRMMEAMDDIVWSIKPQNDSMEKIMARMREFAGQLCDARNIHLKFTHSPEVALVKLNMETRRDLFLIFKEAVNNLAKYSMAENASIDLSIDTHHLMLNIYDDGKGFDLENANEGNGLNNMQKRSAAIKAKLEITAQAGKGCHIFLRLPIS